MQNYESLVIVRATLSEEEISAVLGKIREMIEKLGGTVLQAEGWGRRKLSYEIQGQKKGAYLLFRFQMDGKLIAPLEHQYRLEESILKFLTVRLERSVPWVPAAALGGDKRSVHERTTLEETPPSMLKESLQ